MNELKIGWSEVSIVPEGRKVDLAGQFYERISGKVETPISVTALAIDNGEDSVVFCACDLCSTSATLLAAVRAALPEDCPFPKEKLIISAIHTHTSMAYAQRSDSFGSSLKVLLDLKPDDVEYVPLVHDESPEVLRGEEAKAFLVERIARAALSAWENRATGAIAFGFGRATVGMCRRVCYDDGSAKMWGDTNSASFTDLEGGNDSGIELMFTYNSEKKLTGVIANVACPAQVLEHQSFISSDYMGKVKRNLREKYGEDINYLGLVSPAGDMCPRDLVRWVDAEIKLNDPNIHRDELLPRRADPSMFDVDGCELAARRVANEIFWAIDRVTDYVECAPICHKTMSVDLPLRRVTPSEYAKAKATLDDFFENCGGKINYADNADMMVHSGTIARYKIQHTRDMFTIEVHVLRLADVAFATNPFELFLNYGNQIRARSRATQTFLIQLSCGSFGYLPTERAERGSHYSAFVSSGTTGHVGGEMLVRKTLTEINKMFSE